MINVKGLEVVTGLVGVEGVVVETGVVTGTSVPVTALVDALLEVAVGVVTLSTFRASSTTA